MSVNSTIPATGIRDDSGNRATLDRDGIRAHVHTVDQSVLDILGQILEALRDIEAAIQELDNT